MSLTGMFLVCFNAGLVDEFFGQSCRHTEAMDGLGISSGRVIQLFCYVNLALTLQMTCSIQYHW